MEKNEQNLISRNSQEEFSLSVKKEFHGKSNGFEKLQCKLALSIQWRAKRRSTHKQCIPEFASYGSEKSSKHGITCYLPSVLFLIDGRPCCRTH